jgi:Concanavalin A-like lectin/glucanases superfamily
MALVARVGLAVSSAAWVMACARGIESPLDLTPQGGSGGQAGVAPAAGPGGNPGSGGVSGGGAGASSGSGGSAGGMAGSVGGVGGNETAGSGGAGGGTAGIAGGGGSAGRGGASADASVDHGAPPRDAPPDIPCPGAGTALSFDGTLSQYVLIPAGVMPTGNALRTVEMWVLNRSPIANWAPDHTIFECGGGGNLTTFAMDFDNVGNPRRMELYVNPLANSYFFDTGMTQDVWFHVAGTYDGTRTHAFVNGVEIGTGLAVSGPLATIANQPLYVGSSILRNYLTGSIDEVRVWNLARTEIQIQQDMSFRLVGNEAGLVGYFRFDEGTGTTAMDATGRGNNGTLNPSATPPTYVASGVTLGCR